MNPTTPLELHPLLRRASSKELLIALAGLFISFPFIEPLRSGALIESILLTIVLASGVLAIATRRSTLIIGAIFAVPTLAGRWMNHYRPDIMPPELFLIAGLLFVLFVIACLLTYVMRAVSVDSEVLCASLSAYLLLGLLWTFAYWLIAEIVPNAFSFNTAAAGDVSMKGFNALYFSFITLCTVGYGDITPVSNVARMLAAFEAVTGLLYVAILIARLVAIQATPKPNERS